MWLQKQISLRARERGFHLVTDEVLAQLPEIRQLQTGLAHFFIQHTSASLSLNENADSSVRRDMERHFNIMVPEDAPYWEHTCEGPDDIAAHIKSTLAGAGLTIPVGDGRLLLGTWQGLYLGEHRNHGGSRSLIVTLSGQGDED